MALPLTPTNPAIPIVRQITIERFRGIKHLRWKPSGGLNIVLGGGDTGKSTILDAIALLFSPSTTTVLTDADYFARNVADGFCIEAVVTLPERVGISTQAKLAWPWEWDGENAIVADIDADPPADDPVYRVHVRGTEDLEVVYEIIQPNDEVDHFNVAIRRAVGLVRLASDDRNDRDLRLVQGSALDRLLADRTLRSRLGLRLAQNPVADDLKDDAKESLKKLDSVFAQKALPHDLSIGITTPHGVSLNALIGLTALKEQVHLPISSWGSGTRRLAALEIAALHHEDNPVVVVDELERGLEPYRQRRIVRDLQSSGSQVFLTTHSTIVLRAAANGTFWYLDANGAIGCIARGANSHRGRDPEAYFARLAVVAEGATEVGFLDTVLRRHLPEDLLDLGVVLSDGCGNDETLKVLEAVSGTGLQFAGFADDEGRDPTRWATVKARLGDLLFRWPNGCIESNIVALLSDDKIEAFITPPDGGAGERLRTLAERLGIEDKALPNIQAATNDLRTLIVEAATGSVPDGLDESTKKAWKKHAERWFKSVDGGRELGEKVFSLGLWDSLKPQLEPFIRAVQHALADGAAPAASHE